MLIWKDLPNVINFFLKMQSNVYLGSFWVTSPYLKNILIYAENFSRKIKNKLLAVAILRRLA